MGPMTAIFKLPGDLHGKQTVPRRAILEIDLKFGPWKNYSGWVDELDRNRWIENVEKTNVIVEIMVGTEIVFSRAIGGFESIKMHTEFDDSIPGDRDLHIKIINLNNLPVMHQHEQVAIHGMLQIESVKIQGIELINFMRSSIFDHAEHLWCGNDVDICLPMTTPIYTWMVKNQSAILSGIF
jgi:hypothetical protein